MCADRAVELLGEIAQRFRVANNKKDAELMEHKAAILLNHEQTDEAYKEVVRHLIADAVSVRGLEDRCPLNHDWGEWSRLIEELHKELIKLEVKMAHG